MTNIAGNLIFLISEQHVQFLIIPNYTIRQDSKKGIYRQNFKHFSSTKYITDLGKVNRDNTVNVLDRNVNKSFQNFSSKITNVLDKHMPITKVSLKEIKSKHKL